MRGAIFQPTTARTTLLPTCTKVIKEVAMAEGMLVDTRRTIPEPQGTRTMRKDSLVFFWETSFPVCYSPLGIVKEHYLDFKKDESSEIFKL